MDEESQDSEANGQWSEDDETNSTPPSSPESNLESSPESPPASPSQPATTNPVPDSVIPSIASSPSIPPPNPNVIPANDSVQSSSNSTFQVSLPIEKLQDPNVRAILGLPLLQPIDAPASQDGFVEMRKRRRILKSPPLSPPPVPTSNRFAPLEPVSQKGPLKVQLPRSSALPPANANNSNQSRNQSSENGSVQPSKTNSQPNAYQAPQNTRKYRIPPIFLKDQSQWSLKTARSSPQPVNLQLVMPQDPKYASNVTQQKTSVL
ncbi:proline-rich receptor-like protein kinase PERK9 [Ischnura elegans]|uniref:proline-rich receptor-like protein kinase PERK9 n=1 Tax=Ischnura elegans TaxID=197161 RepID=UPI001ED87928|nr:proline-rich receptor-like protein kinase PERK9 [Ischnura elegans]